MQPDRCRKPPNLAARLGALVREWRERARLTQSELARRCDMSRQLVAWVESGRGNPSLGTIEALLRELGASVDWTVNGPSFIGRARVGDAVHSWMSAYIQRRLEAAGWQVLREVGFDDGRYRGWIDLLAFHEPTGTLLIIELKSRLDDVGGLERTLDWYGRVGATVARQHGWQPRIVRAWAVLLASDEVDTALTSHRDGLSIAFPNRAGSMLEALGAPATMPVGRGLALVDPRSRRRDWLIRGRIDGRRSPAPYRGYAVAATKRPSSR